MAMNQQRLDYLAVHHPVMRTIVARAEHPEGGIRFTLSCGHEGHGVSHFDYSRKTEWKCHPCACEAIRRNPTYAHEFREDDVTEGAR
jgi:hypothetical protein